MVKKSILTILFFLMVFGLSHLGHAETPKLPSLPEPIAALQQDGAQIKYLGRDLGFDGWIAIKNAQEQYFYVTPDGSAFFLGVLFDRSGRAVTFDQMKRLQGQKDTTLNNSETAAPVTAPSSHTPVSPTPTLSKAEQFLLDVQSGHAFPLGSTQTRPNIPTIYMFADPLCPHCKDMIRMLDPAITRGDLQVQVLLVGALAKDSAPLASGILSQKDPGAALYALMMGTKIPPKGDPNNLKIVENLGILTKWKFEGTPITTYRAKDGTVKLLQGAPKSLDILLQDLR